MKTVTVLELKTKAGELVRSVIRTGEEVRIVDNNEVVALLVPSSKTEKNKSGWTTLYKIVAEIDKNGG
jgi:prevent-host-death family protein